MFPVSVEGEFKIAALTSSDLDGVLDELEHALLRVKAYDLRRTARTLTFNGGTVLSKRHVLALVGRSEIDIKAGSPSLVRYRFSLAGSLLYVFAMVLFAFVAAPIFGVPFRFVPILAVIMTVLYTFNYLSLGSRLKKLLHSATAEHDSEFSPE